MGKSTKDNRDKYCRMAKEQHFRARSAFKLLYFQEDFNIFKDVKRVVDLCAAPGSWSQVLSRDIYMKNLKEDGSSDVKILAVDLQPMWPIKGVKQMLGDITTLETADAVISEFKESPADLVVFDGSPELTGIADMDIFMHERLLLSTMYIAANVLKPGGKLIAKILVGDDLQMWVLKSKFRMLFNCVMTIKPPCSRKSSIESYFVCKEYFTDPRFDPSLLGPYLDPRYNKVDHLTGINRKAIAFIARNDFTGYTVEEIEREDPFKDIYPKPDPNKKVVIRRIHEESFNDYNEDLSVKTVYGVNIKYYRIIMEGLSPEARERANAQFKKEYEQLINEKNAKMTKN